MSVLTRSLVLFAILALATVTCADSWLAPKTETYKSASGKLVFTTEPNKTDFFGAAMGTLNKTDKDGGREKVWEAKLVNTPYKVFVADDGKHVVTIDTYANLGFKHVLVIYDAKGKVVVDFELEKLFTNDEVDKHVKRTAGSRWWSGDAKFSFDDKRGHFVVNMNWGKEIRVALATGKIE